MVAQLLSTTLESKQKLPALHRGLEGKIFITRIPTHGRAPQVTRGATVQCRGE